MVYASISDVLHLLIPCSVDAYVVQTATLHLRHNYPTSEPPKTVQVNIRILLESIKRNELEIGSWVNVIGYVERTKDKGISVQAIAVWDAGNIDLNAYESAIDARKASGI
jgi:hypothetical protein